MNPDNEPAAPLALDDMLAAWETGGGAGRVQDVAPVQDVQQDRHGASPAERLRRGLWEVAESEAVSPAARVSALRALATIEQVEKDVDFTRSLATLTLAELKQMALKLLNPT